VDGLFDHLEWVAYVWFVMVGGGVGDFQNTAFGCPSQIAESDK